MAMGPDQRDGPPDRHRGPARRRVSGSLARIEGSRNFLHLSFYHFCPHSSIRPLRPAIDRTAEPHSSARGGGGAFTRPPAPLLHTLRVPRSAAAPRSYRARRTATHPLAVPLHSSLGIEVEGDESRRLPPGGGGRLERPRGRLGAPHAPHPVVLVGDVDLLGLAVGACKRSKGHTGSEDKEHRVEAVRRGRETGGEGRVPRAAEDVRPQKPHAPTVWSKMTESPSR